MKRGEHLSGIAAKYGLASWKSIGEHPDNKSTCEGSRDPHVLHPGECLTIPERETREESADTGSRHRFRVARPELVLRLDLCKLVDGSLEGARCQLIVEREVFELEPQDGIVEQRIPVSAREATLVVDSVSYPLSIGDLDPVKGARGQSQRLHNLGYLIQSDEESEADEASLEAAILAFQSDHGLAVDGICGRKTQPKLVEVHGC